MTEYRVAELARAAHTSVRNVRVYQDRGLLPPPRREGRIGLYGDAHLARLLLIGRLLGRGYTFATIGELFETWSKGEDLANMLGLREALPLPESGHKPVRLSRAEIGRRFGTPFSPAVLERAVELGLLIADGKDATTYLVPEPSVFDAGTHLVAAGVPLDAVLELAAAIQDDLAHVAQRFMSALLAQVTDLDQDQPLTDQPLTNQPLTEDEAQHLLRLQPHTQHTVEALLRMALRQETERLLAQYPPDAGATEDA